jgi:hypothetical protein
MMVNAMVKQIFAISLSILFLTACASHSPPPSLERGESIAIQPPQLSRLDVTVDSKTVKAGKGLALGTVGAIGGAALYGTGGALLGLSCGPLFIVCSPMAAAAGIVAGGVGGGVLGAAYGGRGGISGDKARRFNEITSQSIDAVSIEMQLYDQFNELVSESWILDSNSPNTIVINIRSVYFEQHSKERVQLVFDSEMEVDFAGRTDKFRFKHAGTPRHVDDWLSDDGNRFQREMDAAIENVTSTMIARLDSGV